MSSATGVPTDDRVWVGTSWKMTKTLAQAKDFASALRDHDWSRTPHVQPFVLPPTTALSAVRDGLGPDSAVLLGAQNAHWEDEGPWTGEISVPQAADAGAEIVAIGHSERREHFGETDETANLKVRAALRHGVVPLVCVGEPDDVFRRGGSVRHVVRQVRAALLGVDDLRRVVVAYEPVWAIGEHGRPAKPEQVAPVFEALHQELASSGVRLIYGGSVIPGNTAELLGVPGIGGVFVGRAAWTVEGFITLVEIAAHTRSPDPRSAGSARPGSTTQEGGPHE
jgi:triosephosphate isomerase